MSNIVENYILLNNVYVLTDELLLDGVNGEFVYVISIVHFE